MMKGHLPIGASRRGHCDVQTTDDGALMKPSGCNRFVPAIVTAPGSTQLTVATRRLDRTRRLPVDRHGHQLPDEPQDGDHPHRQRAPDARFRRDRTPASRTASGVPRRATGSRCSGHGRCQRDTRSPIARLCATEVRRVLDAVDPMPVAARNPWCGVLVCRSRSTPRRTIDRRSC
jgi:hypothetical protein